MASSQLHISRDAHPSSSGRPFPSQQSFCVGRNPLLRSIRRQLRSTSCSALVLSIQGSNLPADGQQQQPLPPFERQLPPEQEKAGSSKQPEKEKPLVRVQLSVHYRVHSRQLLCIGGSQIPFGWSFLSIAKVPMTWNRGDIWTCEVLLPAGQRVEYKYVILEEQDWTKIADEDAQGIVEVTYRTGTEPGKPPDVQVITRAMAIVAWQPGPNRVIQVPTEAELQQLTPGAVVERVPARGPSARSSSSQEDLRLLRKQPDPYEGTWEVLSLQEGQLPLLDRHDVWGWSPSSSSRPPGLRGFRLDN